MKNYLLIASVCQFLAVSLQAQTLYVPSGTGGIGTSTNSNVGIGTSTPKGRFEVVGGNSYFDPTYSLFIPSTGNSYFWSGIDGVDNVRFSVWSKFTLFNPTAAGLNPNNTGWNIQLGARDGSIYARGGAYFAINSGNVGIGTASPGARFHIQSSNGVAQSIQLDNKEIKFRGDGVAHFSLYANRIPGFFTIENTSSAVGMGITGAPVIIAFGSTGNVLIGKTYQTNTTYKLDVSGKVRADEITVNTTGADFVFEPKYKLLTLNEVEAYIKANKHLPEIAPATDMQTNGVSMGEMQAKLLQKVEELTLYLIEKDRQLNEQKEIISELKESVEELNRKLNSRLPSIK